MIERARARCLPGASVRRDKKTATRRHGLPFVAFRRSADLPM
ncbi:hypothetical protein C7S17_3009 [Burkholderia thailandensis]|nr:hypothetical protein [Burkholderia thailandensis]